jgi:hypothetical protein
MRVILEPADTAGQEKLAEALQECGMAKLEHCDEQAGEVRQPFIIGKRLCFNFKRIHKKDVYQAFLDIYARGGVEMENQELIMFLARHTNLGSETSIKTLFYRYKQHIHV